MGLLYHVWIIVIQCAMNSDIKTSNLGNSSRNFFKLTRKGERKNIEFKENLIKSHHLKKERKQQLASQMKYRLERGDGEAIYFIGVDDEGQLLGLQKAELEESIFVLGKIAHEVNSQILEVETQVADRGRWPRSQSHVSRISDRQIFLLEWQGM